MTKMKGATKTNQRGEGQRLTALWCPWGCPWAESAVRGYCSAPLFLSMCKDLDSEGLMANTHSPLYLEIKPTEKVRQANRGRHIGFVYT